MPRRLLLGLLAAACVPAVGGASSGAAAAGAVPRNQELAVLLGVHRVHVAPRSGSRQAALLGPHTPITGEATTLPVIGHAPGWLEVELPGRPNGSSGWISRRGTRSMLTGWHIVVNLAARLVHVYRHGVVVKVFSAVVGKPSTPTPTGQFFVQETLQMQPGQAGGPFALALSARSNTFQEFDGGPGQIALHGRDQLGGTLGSAASHGCVRLETSSISWLASRIGPGTPTTIYG